MQHRASFRGFEIHSRGKQNDQMPEIVVRGKLTYQANLNTENPVGTVQSIEHVLRNFDKLASEQQNRITRTEKELADYKEQSKRPFEHQARLYELLLRQAQLTKMLDLDKSDQQAIAIDSEDGNEREQFKMSKAAISYMRASGRAIDGLPITERKPPETGTVDGRVIAREDGLVAIATAINSFVIVQMGDAADGVVVGQEMSLKLWRGVPTMEQYLAHQR